MNYLLILLSISMETCKNIFLNSFSKDGPKNDADIYKFNTSLYIGSALILLPMIGTFRVSSFSLLMAVAFAAVTSLCQIFYLKALKHGSMAYSTFLMGSGLIIPTICGILFWGETPKITQYIAFPTLLLAMGLVLAPKKGEEEKFKITGKWLFSALMTLVFTGLIGVIQAVHQESEFKGEIMPFLVYTFIFTTLGNYIVYLITNKTQEKSTYKIKSKVTVFAVISGLFMGVVNWLNLYLAGCGLSKIIVFPALNGGLIFMSLLAAVIFFKEKPSPRQWVGMIAGITALCLLGL